MTTAFSVQQFGRYTLLERLATGGSAEIWRSKTVGVAGFERQVVVKRFFSNLTGSRDFAKSLIAEATRTAQLSHANIVQIFDFDQVNGSYYVAMELVEGRDLRSALHRSHERKAPLSVNQTAYIVCELLKGLTYAHERKEPSIHREISPQNILVSFQGEIKLNPFGIGDVSLLGLSAGESSGKTAYYSPEQVSQQPMGPASDLFMLGCVFYELLTGESCFQGKDHEETKKNIQEKQPVPPSMLKKEVPKELDAFVLGLLEKDPAKRPTSAREAQMTLANFLHAAVIEYSSIDLAAYLCNLFADELGPDEGIPETERMPGRVSPKDSFQTSDPGAITGPLPAQAQRGAFLWVLLAAALAALGAGGYFVFFK
jgi:eukaryotic-like serine/threonine-protein kinase